MPHTQAHVFILQLKRTELRHFVIWTPGWKKWIPVKEMLKSDQKFFEIPPPIDQTDDDATQITSAEHKSGSFNSELTYTEIAFTTMPPEPGNFEADHMNWEKTPVIPVLKKTCAGDALTDDERREYKRFPHRIELVLMTKKGKSFRSSSLNVSLGGALLREPVPSGLLKDVMDLLVINPFPDKETPSHLLIKGRVVGDAKDRRRLMFYDVSPEVQKQLRAILERYQKNYKEHKKKKAS